MSAPSLRDTELDADIERMLTIHRNRKRYNWNYYDGHHGGHAQTYRLSGAETARRKAARQRERRRAQS